MYLELASQSTLHMSGDQNNDVSSSVPDHPEPVEFSNSPRFGQQISVFGLPIISRVWSLKEEEMKKMLAAAKKIKEGERGSEVEMYIEGGNDSEGRNGNDGGNDSGAKNYERDDSVIIIEDSDDKENEWNI